MDPDPAASSNRSERVAELETEERQVSARRRRLHARIEFLRVNGNADGSPASPEQLAALEEQERELSTNRRELHRRIDELRGGA